MQVSLFADGFRNEQFEKNMAFFKDFHPGLYQALDGYVPKQYRICLNPDDTYNIINMENSNLVYPYDEKKNLVSKIRLAINDLGVGVTYGGVLFDFDEASCEVNIDPIQKKMRRGLYECGPLGRDSVADQSNITTPHINSDYVPYYRVYGVGLGYHIQEIIRLKNISFISIYEPNIDLFYTSLYTISWSLIFQYFSIKQKVFSSEDVHINLYLGSKPEAVVEKNRAYLKKMCRYLVLANARYANFAQEDNIKKLIQLERDSDQSVLDDVTNGWYEDQRAGFYFSARNIKKKNPFFSGRKVESFLRIFLVGNGPSLDESIKFVKDNQSQAIIISCGSAFSTLLRYGVIPDYQVVQERDWHITDYECDYDSSLLKQITLLKLNVISPLVDKYYKDVLVFQKYNDPGSCFLDSSEYPVSTHVNPTVTNAGVAISAEMGADEVYLFGIDYGATKNALTMHASGSLYENENDEVVSEIEVPSAFGGVASSTKFFSWSRRTTEDKISRYSGIAWFNVEDGAMIEGTSSVHVNDIHSFSRKINKDKIKQKIQDCFDSNYDAGAVIDYLRGNAVQEVSDYLDMILSFSRSEPSTREELLMVVTLMERAMNQHKLVGGPKGALHYYPGFLLSGGVQEFILGLFGQAMYGNDDLIISDLFRKSMVVLQEYRDQIVADMSFLVDRIGSDEYVEIKNAY